jgi:putative ABC transport system permease protein
MLTKLALRSLKARKLMAGLTIFSIAVSMFVLFSVEHLRNEVRANFERAVSGVDIIAGARTSQLNLLLYSVFHIGNPSSNVSWQTYQQLSQNKAVKWAIPISLGDSHEGFPVVGTTKAFFNHFKYADQHAIQFKHGGMFDGLQEMVIGSEVAKALEYPLGHQVVLAHGTGKVSFTKHKQFPFQVVGILTATGTPVDQSVYVPVTAIDAMHTGMTTSPLRQHISKERTVAGEHEHEFTQHAQHIEHSQQAPSEQERSIDEKQAHPNDSVHFEDSVNTGYANGPALSAIFLGLNNKISTLQIQRAINTDQEAPLSAILPGVALAQLWSIMAGVETSLSLVSVLILLAAMLGMLTMLLASMHERQREIAVLRALGANASVIVLMMECEALFLAFSGCILGYMMTNIGIALFADLIQSQFGLVINPLPYSDAIIGYTLLGLGLSALLALGPALSAYKSALNSGLSVR